MENIKISNTKPLSINEVWAKFTAATLEVERLKSELADKVSEIKQRDIRIEGLHKHITYLENNIENILEQNKKILAETVKTIREINHPEIIENP